MTEKSSESKSNPSGPPPPQGPQQVLTGPNSSVSTSLPASAGHLVSIEQMRTEAYSGPLPSPDHLRKFGEIDPSLPGKIVAMATDEQRHRHATNDAVLEIERADVRGTHFTNNLRLCLGAGVTVALGVGAFVLALMGNNGGAGILFGITLAVIVPALIRGKDGSASREPKPSQITPSE
jgi:uncharacterized membrane protein